MDVMARPTPRPPQTVTTRGGWSTVTLTYRRKPRYGLTFHAVRMYEAVCADCGIDGTVLADLGHPDGVPYMSSLAMAAWMLPSRGWTRARDLERPGADRYDQLWRCGGCSARASANDPVTAHLIP